jgi:hypothetical protein
MHHQWLKLILFAWVQAYTYRRPEVLHPIRQYDMDYPQLVYVSDLRFSQSTCDAWFRKDALRMRICLFSLVDELVDGTTELGDIEQLSCYVWGGHIYTFDHRRLVAMRIYCSVHHLPHAVITCNVIQPPFTAWEEAKMQQTLGTTIMIRVDQIGHRSVYIPFSSVQMRYWVHWYQSHAWPMYRPAHFRSTRERFTEVEMYNL